MVIAKEFGAQQSKVPIYQNDLDLDPMTLILKFDLDMVKMSHHTKNEVSMSRHLKVIAQTDRQTHRHTDRKTHRQYENITSLHMWAVKKKEEGKKEGKK